MLSYLKYFARHNFLLKNKIEDVNKLFKLDLNELLEWEFLRFQKLVTKAYKLSKIYQTYYDEHDFKPSKLLSREDISKIPPIDKQFVRKHYDSILIGSKLIGARGYTSGTSGSPLCVFRSYGAILTENAYLWHYRIQNEVPMGARFVSIRGVLDKSKVYHFNKAENTLYISSYHINRSSIHKIVELIESYKPLAISGYPSSLELLSNELSHIGIRLHIPSAFTSSETLYDHQRVKIEQQISPRLLDWYGNAERTIAYAQYGSIYRQLPLYSLIEQVDNTLYSTSLINESFPLIRYQLTDRLEFTKPGQTYLANKIDGRSDDYLLLPDDSKIGRLDIAFKGIAELDYAQFEQCSKEEVDLRIVTTPNFSQKEEHTLISNVRALVGHEITINLLKVTEGEIKKTAAGKFKLVINHLLNRDKHV